MHNFNYYTPTEVVFGKGTESQVGELVKKYGGTKVLIHYGRESARKSGLLDRVEAALDEAGIAHVSLGGVVPNPHLSLVYEGIELCRREGVDFLLAVGGGSVIDSTKAIGYGLANEGDVWDYYEHTRVATKCMPLGSVLTMAAAGSEMSNSSVITKAETGSKRSFNSDASRAKFVVMNPEFTLTLPAYQTASGCTDILMHTMERYFSNGEHSELTDSIAEGLMKTVIHNAKILKEQPDNYDARAEVMWASSLSHNGLTECGNAEKDFATHGMEHEMGGMFDVTHGAGLAAIWGSWARYVYQNCLHRFVKFAIDVMEVAPGATDEETAIKGIEAMEAFYRAIDMPTSMRELGIEPTDEQCREMATRCSIAAGGKKGSAKVLYEEDMYQIYKNAL